MSVGSLDEVLQYLKSVLEGSNALHLNRWLKRNMESLRSLLPGPDVAKLKFKPMAFARSLLAKHAVDYVENRASVAREQYLLNISDEFLDDAGELQGDYYQRIFDGLLRDFLTGDFATGQQRMLQYLREHQGTAQPLLAEPVIDLLFFARMDATVHPDLSRAIVMTMKRYFDEQGISMQEVDEALKSLHG